MTGAKRLLLVAGLLSVAAGGPGCRKLRDALYTPRVKVTCKVMDDKCQFQNFGDPGQACVNVELFHQPSGRTLRSRPVCSGMMERGSSTVVPVEYEGGADARTYCMGQDLKGDFAKNCQVAIREVLQ
jgi:hypothetical protein